MKNPWYTQNKDELNRVLEKFLQSEKNIKELHGLIVPHASYRFSGAVAGKAFSLLKDKKIEKVVVLGPSHYVGFKGIRAYRKLKTPFGKLKLIENNFPKIDYEHSVLVQMPFLQKLNSDVKVLPLIVGEVSGEEAQKIAEKISQIGDALYVFSTDLSHLFPYKKAFGSDKRTIKIIEDLKINDWKSIDACGKFPLLILMHLCKIKKWKPKLIEYKNSGDITGNKGAVVGYASFWF